MKKFHFKFHHNQLLVISQKAHKFSIFSFEFHMETIVIIKLGFTKTHIRGPKNPGHLVTKNIGIPVVSCKFFESIKSVIVYQSIIFEMQIFAHAVH